VLVVMLREDNDRPQIASEFIAGWRDWVDDLAEMNTRDAGDPRVTTWTPDDYAGLLFWRAALADSLVDGWTPEEQAELQHLDDRFGELTKPDLMALRKMRWIGHPDIPDRWFTRRIPVSGCVAQTLDEWTTNP